jgi:hypothetical protein
MYHHHTFFVFFAAASSKAEQASVEFSHATVTAAAIAVASARHASKTSSNQLANTAKLAKLVVEVQAVAEAT